MQPKTFYGWYNKIVRRFPYNEKTASVLDHTFNPSLRRLTTVDRSISEKPVVRKKTFKATMSDVNLILKQRRKELSQATDF